ncbi:MAG: hypothetical protein ACOCZV_00570 [Nanoarchaeota archaeon]
MMKPKDENKFYGGVIALALIGLFGLVLAGNGITGLIVSQTCCDGPDCDLEYRCEYAKEPSTEQPGSATSITTTGTLILALSTTIYIHHKRKHMEIPPLNRE